MAHLWTSLGNAAKVAGIASGVKSMYDAYQALGSPNAFLQSSGETLDRVRSRLQGLTPQQRAEIEQNVASNNGSHKTIHDIEVQLGELLDMHCRLSKWFEDANIVDRHLPFTQFRHRLVSLQKAVKELLNDTWNTTVPDVDNLMFTTPGQSGQVTVPTLATLSSQDVSPTRSGLPPGTLDDSCKKSGKP